MFPFSSAKISRDHFLVIDHKFRISPLPIFPISPPDSRKLLFLHTFSNSPLFSKNSLAFLHTLCVFRFSPTFTMMHSCITQYTYWTPLLPGFIYPARN